MFRLRSLVVASFAVVLSLSSVHAGDLRLKLPKRSKYTPVQKLNREGVAAVEKHQYDKARKLFYEAYLIDPNDPFTLNNLGYLAELEGEADRARKFYQLATEVGSDAIVDRASNDAFVGKPVSAVAGNAEDKGIKINRLNSEAIALLNKDRAPEADLILQRALTIDASNPFTLNNLGYAKEKQGELEAAYQFYSTAANSKINDRVEIAVNPDWRGRGIREVATNNANKLRRRLSDDHSVEEQVARLNLRGISAMNRNDRRTGRQLIEQAYKLNPEDPFTLNNMGYLAEMDGDRETADYYYDRARNAEGSGQRIAMATRRSAVGKPIGEVASVTDSQILNRMEAARVARQQEGGPVALRRRDNSLVPEPEQPVSRPQYRVSDANGNLVLPPRPSVNSNTPTQGGIAMPLPDSQQPTTVRQGETDGGMMMPLPENQQPTTVHEGQNDGGLLMPLPDDQQPGATQNPAMQQPTTQQPAIGAPSYVQPAPSTPPSVTTPQSAAPPSPSVQRPAPVQPQTVQPSTQQPTTTPPATTTQPAAPSSGTQSQTPPPAQNQQPQGGLLLPLPDDQQPPEARSPNSQPQTQPAPAQKQPAPNQIPPSQNPPQAQLTPQPSDGVSAPRSTTASVAAEVTPPVPTPAAATSPAAAPRTPPANTSAKPKRINDNDPRTQPAPAQNSGVKKISDQ
jgi:Flp pilus assembly protein TadD